MLIDYPNSLVSSSALDTSLDAPSSVGGDLERVPPPGSEALPPPTKVDLNLYLFLYIIYEFSYFLFVN